MRFRISRRRQLMPLQLHRCLIIRGHRRQSELSCYLLSADTLDGLDHRRRGFATVPGKVAAAGITPFCEEWPRLWWRWWLLLPLLPLLPGAALWPRTRACSSIITKSSSMRRMRSASVVSCSRWAPDVRMGAEHSLRESPRTPKT